MKPPVEAPTSRQRRPAGSTPERVERVAQLDPAARDVGRRRVDPELDVGLHELARLGGLRVARAEPHLARHHRRRGAGAGREEPALRQQGVEADPGHAPERYKACGLPSQTFRPAVPHPGCVTRSISLPLHSALELLGGLALLAGPFLLGAGARGLVAASRSAR